MMNIDKFLYPNINLKEWDRFEMWWKGKHRMSAPDKATLDMYFEYKKERKNEKANLHSSTIHTK